ncbi:P-selectin-like isoform X2, partial [Clarias magur]
MDFYNTHVTKISTFYILLVASLSQWTGVEGWSYHRSEVTMDWAAAREWCRANYTDMVAIQNHDEIEHLNSILPKVAGYYWIGIRKINNIWTWVGTNKPLTAEAENWAQGEPNNGRNNEDCVEIYIKRARDEGKWNDESCKKKKTALCYTASCQKDSCSYKGECVETINSHRCECFEGFYGEKCEHVVKCEANEIFDPEHGDVQCHHPNGEFSYKSECKYSCNEGYQLVGTETTQCIEAWSNKPPTCELIRCFELNMTLHGAIQCSHSLLPFSYQSSCEFSCEEGYILTGSSSSWLMCDAFGNWNDSQPTCEAVRCPTLDVPENGTMNCSGESYGSKCVFSCNAGFRLLGESELTCTKTAQWSQKTPSCTAVQCPALQTPQDGSVSCTAETLSSGSICSFSCSQGFILVGASSIDCTETGEWSTDIPSCTAIQCSTLQTPQNGSVSCTDETLSTGSICSFSCADGFNLEGASSIVCTDTGEWSTDVPSCTAIRCPTLDVPENGTMNCSGESYGSKCVFSCNAGFRLLGESELTCTKTVQWSQKTPSCTAVHCPALQTPQDGSVSCTAETLSSGSICSFSCSQGFILVGASSIDCTETGEWSTDIPSCTAVQCSTLQTPQNGSVSCTDETLNSGSLCSFNCAEGFILEGASSIVCTGTGEWSTDVPSCTAVRCSSLKEPNNGFINCSSEEAVFSTSCSFTCLSGYQLNGHKMVMCGLNGSWTGEVPECQAHPAPFSLSLVSGLTIGVGGTTALSSLALAFSILKRLRKMKAKKFDLRLQTFAGDFIRICSDFYRLLLCVLLFLPQKDRRNSAWHSKSSCNRTDALRKCEKSSYSRDADKMIFWKHIRVYVGWTVLMIMMNKGVQAWSYNYTTNGMNWETAREWCRQHFTDMVAIQNKEEVMHLNQILPFYRSYYWIGLRKIAGQWTWVGTMKPLALEATSWATGEPNNQGTSEDCVEIYIKRAKDTGMWNDDKCSKRKGALCYTASCSEWSCSEHGECVETIGNYTCKCNPGFTGHRCDEAVECGRVKSPEQGFMQCNHVYGDFRFNSSCHFHCAHGYILRGSERLQCLQLGKWDSDPPECQVVECPPIETTGSGGNMTCSHPLHTNSYNSSCVFLCEEGFELRGSDTTQCDHTGQWTHNIPTCTAVTCEPLVIPVNGHMNCTDPLGTFSFRSSCAVSCEEGYTLRGENTLTCLKTGIWSAETPACEVVRCSALSSAPHGSMRCTDPLEQFAYRSDCRSECDTGFLLRGSNHTECNTQGKWSHSLPVCEAVQCSPVSVDSSNVRMSCTHPLSTNSYNSTCVFNCDEGFKLIGSYETQCDHMGQWTLETPTCKAVTCDHIVTPVNGHMNCTDPLGTFSFRSSCAVSCEEGYTLRGENTLICLMTGTWSAETPACEVVRCSALSSAPHGSMRCTDPLEQFAYRSDCRSECDTGFLLRGSNHTECNTQGKWSHSLPVCEAVTCEPLVTPVNGHMNCTDPLGTFSFRSLCAVSCEEGYTLKGENTLTCLKTGTWSAEAPACEAVQCSPVSVDSSNVRMSCTHPLSTNSYNSTCVFNCDEGFKLIGSYETQCDHMGQWTLETPTCKAVICDYIVTPVNGHMNCTDPLGTFSFRSSCAVSCEEGYTLRGENTLICLKTGTWSAETPACEARQCPLLSRPEQGWMNCSHPHYPFSYGSRCTFGCELGYVLREEFELHCTTSGSWSQAVPSCKVVHCKSLMREPLSHLDSTPVPFMNCSHPRGNFSFGSQCMFRCPEGYRLNGTSDLLCTPAGLWTDPLPKCIIEDMPLGTGLLVYGAIGAASSMGLLLMGGFVMLLVRHFNTK